VSTGLVWFRRDLRLADNPALTAAAEQHGKLLLVYVDSREEEGDWTAGAASCWWLHRSLASLDSALAAHGQRLLLFRGRAGEVLARLAGEHDLDAVYWNRLYDPALTARDAEVKAALKRAGIAARSFRAGLLLEPWEIETGAGKPYRVFTPFWRACQALLPPAAPIPAPRELPPGIGTGTPAMLMLDELGLEPRIPWYEGIADAWTPGEEAAQTRLEEFCSEVLKDYAKGRDVPARAGTSRLSPHLHYGELSPRSIWHRIQAEVGARGAHGGAEAFLRELGWREFAHHVLFHFPHTPQAPLNEKFADFPWRPGYEALLEAWQRGRTGLPIVDAGMRELWQTGWMHNRVRMIVASVLVKNIRAPWLDGARWFWDTLVDADLANNTLGWQWSAGCGADAAPYFRIFNPVRQGEKFDPDGEYVRRFVPELASVPDKWVHQPWTLPREEAERVGFRIGRDYPEPVIDLKESRAEALAALAVMKEQAPD
jgi:deoxyribodipyrimidine photo-lyase